MDTGEDTAGIAGETATPVERASTDGADNWNSYLDNILASSVGEVESVSETSNALSSGKSLAKDVVPVSSAQFVGDEQGEAEGRRSSVPLRSGPSPLTGSKPLPDIATEDEKAKGSQDGDGEDVTGRSEDTVSSHETDTFLEEPALPAQGRAGAWRDTSSTPPPAGGSSTVQGHACGTESGKSGSQSPQLALLLPFVPRLALKSYDTNAPHLPTGPMHMLVDAAVGLFDVSGFSTIADRLEKEEANAGNTSAEDEGVGLLRRGSFMPEQGRSSGLGGRRQSTLARKHSMSVGMNDSITRVDKRVGRLRAMMSVGMVIGGRTNFKKGSAAERLTDYLNYILGLLTDIVEMHGGDILKFAGDAIIVCWPRTEELAPLSNELASDNPRGEHLEGPCLRAVLCARDAMQACTDKLLNSGDPVMSSLGLHIGLGASRILAGHVGGVENRWEFFITGEACEEMNQAEKDANNMEIVFSASVGTWIRQFKGLEGGAAELASVRLASGNERLVFLQCSRFDLPDIRPPAPVRGEGMCKVLKMYVPQPVKINLKEGGVETGGALRKITVVFVELLDVDVFVSQNKHALDEVDKTVRKIQEAVCHYDATLRQFIVDDKGTVAIVVFGLPPIYHEDNAARGISLGLRLLQQGVQAKIGVTTGTAFAGIIGSSSRQEYAAVGDVVNMSARLMGKAARNTVLCDASTAKEAEDAFNFEEAMRIAVKGKEDKIAVFQPAAKEGVRRSEAANAFLDRGDHAEGLEDLMASANVLTGTKTVLIEGERGSGKSILLSKAVGMMDGQEIHTFSSAGDIHERHTSLFPFKQILCQLLELDQESVNWYGTGHRNAPPTPGAPPSTSGHVGGISATSAAAAAASAAAASAAGSTLNAATTVVGDEPFGSRRKSRRGSVMAFLSGSSEPKANANDASGKGAEKNTPLAQTPAPASVFGVTTRPSVVMNLPGRRRSTEAPAAPHPHEITLARGHLMNNAGFVSLMTHAELNKFLPLLNMILPLYNEQAAGAVTTLMQDTHEKLRRLADMIAALLVHRLEAEAAPKEPSVRVTKDAFVSAHPRMARRGSIASFRAAILGDGKQEPASAPESKGCRAALVIDNAQWLDHNSWELMLLLRRALPGMLILAAFRPFTEMRLKRNIPLKTVPGSLKMNMGRLTATQVMLLLSQSFGVQRTNEELLEFLESTAKGNPRDVIHMMEDLLKERIVQVDHNLGAVIILKELSENSLKIKDHTSAPIIAKFDQLNRSTQQLVQAAAVIGQEVPLDLLVDMYSLPTANENLHRPRSGTSTGFPAGALLGSRTEKLSSTGKSGFGDTFGGGGGCSGGDVDAEINTLVRVGLLERNSCDSVRFVAKYMVTVIYDMILHSKRVDMHKEIVRWYVTRKTFVDLRPHFRFLGKHAMAAGEQDLGVTLFVMAAEVAISCGDPTEAQLACAAVTQGVDNSSTSDHLTLLDQILRETKLHLLVGQTAILSQDWESAEMSLQLAVDMSGTNSVDGKPRESLGEKLFSRWRKKRQHVQRAATRLRERDDKGEGRRLTCRGKVDWDEIRRRSTSCASDQSSASASDHGDTFNLNNVERFGAGGVMLKKYGKDAKVLLNRLAKYQAMTRSFHMDLLTENKKIVEAHSKRTDPARLPRYLRGATLARVMNTKRDTKRAYESLEIQPAPRVSIVSDSLEKGGLSGFELRGGGGNRKSIAGSGKQRTKVAGGVLGSFTDDFLP